MLLLRCPIAWLLNVAHTCQDFFRSSLRVLRWDLFHDAPDLISLWIASSSCCERSPLGSRAPTWEVVAPSSPSSPTCQQRQRSLSNKNNNNYNPFANQDQQKRPITSPLASKIQSTFCVPVSSFPVPLSDNNNRNSENIPSASRDN